MFDQLFDDNWLEFEAANESIVEPSPVIDANGKTQDEDAAETIVKDYIAEMMEDVEAYQEEPKEPQEGPERMGYPHSDVIPSLAEMHNAAMNLVMCISRHQELDWSITEAKKHLVDFKAKLKLMETEAEMNWDSKGKVPFDPDKPFNDGSNPEKRALINRQIFARAYAEIAEIEKYIAENSVYLDRFTSNIAMWRVIVDYHERAMKYQELHYIRFGPNNNIPIE